MAVNVEVIEARMQKARVILQERPGLDALEIRGTQLPNAKLREIKPGDSLLTRKDVAGVNNAAFVMSPKNGFKYVVSKVKDNMVRLKGPYGRRVRRRDFEVAKDIVEKGVIPDPKYGQAVVGKVLKECGVDRVISENPEIGNEAKELALDIIAAKAKRAQIMRAHKVSEKLPIDAEVVRAQFVLDQVNAYQPTDPTDALVWASARRYAEAQRDLAVSKARR